MLVLHRVVVVFVTALLLAGCSAVGVPKASESTAITPDVTSTSLETPATADPRGPAPTAMLAQSTSSPSTQSSMAYPPTSPSLPPPTPFNPGVTLPPPVQTTAIPNSDLSVRERIDRYWSHVGHVDCLGMAAPQSIEELAGSSDLIVIGRPLGAQTWTHAPYPLPNSLITFQVTRILKGKLNYEPADFVQVYVEGLPPGTVADIDHLLLLSLLPDRELFYHLSAGWMSVYANVDGRVVTPEYAAIKRVYHDSIFSLALDGTRFDDLVDRVTNPQPTPEAALQIRAARGYFAC